MTIISNIIPTQAFPGSFQCPDSIIYIPRIADGVLWHTHSASISNPSFSLHDQAQIHLLRLLNALLTRGAVQPESDKREPSENGDPDTANPHPRTADLETPRVFVVSKVPDSHLPFLVDVGDERTTVVDAEVKDTVLVGSLESGTEDGSICSLSDRGEVETLERRQHAKLKLDVVLGGGVEGSEVVVHVLGDLDLEVLQSS